MIKPSVVADIRQLFVDGATPSELMRHIATAHPADPRLHVLVSDYYRAAFGIPFLRHVVAGEDVSPHARHAHYNRDVVPEMVQRVGDWKPDGLQGSWLEGIVVRSTAEQAERLRAGKCEELARVWDLLNDAEQQFIIRKMAQKDFYWDALKCLAALTERLQEKVVELEGKLNQQSHHGFASEAAVVAER